MSDYDAFLASKAQTFRGTGVSVDPASLHPSLFPHQAAINLWALRKGRAAIFSDCGTGKTRMQLEWARHIPGRVLGFAPLFVAEQTMQEAKSLGMEVLPHGSGGRIEILNYEMLHHVKPEEWDGVFLDESSILKSLDGKTRGRLIEMFQDAPYRLCCTATPSPNDISEIGNHAHFLGIMTRAEMLGSFFVNRGKGSQDWDLKGHAREAFYRWLASWACFLRKPSDLGFSDEGFELPPIHYHPEIIPANMATPGKLFADKLKGIQDRAAVRKMTAAARVDRAAEILKASTKPGIAWCGLNAEQDALAATLGGDCVSIHGSMKAGERQEAMARFLSGGAQWLVTKPSIAGHGMNLQLAPLQVFVGLSDSYEEYYQCPRRSWRYGQREEVDIHIVLTDMEEEIFSNVRRKEREAAALQEDMVGRIAEFERAEIEGREEVAPYSEEKVSGDGWELWRGDAVKIMPRLPAESVDLAVFSPPFAELYTYSASPNDMGNCRSVEEFLEGFLHFACELERIMKTGRIAVCHCQQLPLQKAKHGVIGLRDFRGDLIRTFQAAGFILHGEVTIDKNPQAQAIRTKAKGLLFAQLKKDASWMRPAMADYLVLLRKKGDNVVPVIPDCSNEEWIEWAHNVWYHCGDGKTLQAAEAREEADEKHICALQLPTIRRCVRLWSNKGEIVFSPFAGIGSEGHEALWEGRRFLGVELKASYHRTAVKNLQAAARGASSMLPLVYAESEASHA